uniref:Cilia- and flagella-associated protein 52 n=1 Tax=Phaeomonas parva TaxID=124430 RepID=A0A7S1TXU3_9STRA
MALAEDHQDLELEAVIGFGGEVLGGLCYSPCGDYLIYPLGSNVVVKSNRTGRQVSLTGHSLDVSTLAVSRDGTMIATGQKQHLGVKADIIVWDLTEAKARCDAGESVCDAVLYTLRQHSGGIMSVDFSCDSRYLASVGGQDDNSLVVWDLESGRPICGSPAATDQALCLKWLHGRNDRLVTAGHFHLRVWQIDASFPKMHAVNAKMGPLRRVIETLDITPDDVFAVCGTQSGDLVRFTIDRDGIQDYNDPDTVTPSLELFTKDKFVGGVKSVCCVLNERSGATNYLVGGGDGSVAYVNPSMNKVKGMSAQVIGAVTSIVRTPEGNGFHIGTDQANRYILSEQLDAELKGTCHYGGVNDIVFPKDCSDLFITCSVTDIRVWRTEEQMELLRIQVMNLECNCVGITDNGACIISGWSDGKIRAFTPESGQLLFVVSDAHAEAVTAIAVTRDDVERPPWRIVTGGMDGRVRVWNITSSYQSLLFNMKEHRGPINSIVVSPDNSRAVSASSDGSCIIWDLERYVRIAALFEPTVFNSVKYHPDESQLLTCSANYKITYWDAIHGDMIRVLDAADAEVCAVDVDEAGEAFVSGGADKLVKVWHYDDGIVQATGRGHSGTIQAIKFSPDERRIISAGKEGSIFIWRNPAKN